MCCFLKSQLRGYKENLYSCVHPGLCQTLTHLNGAVLDVDLGHVGHVAQALHAVSLPGPHRLRQDLELQVLSLTQILALCLDSTRPTWNV